MEERAPVVHAADRLDDEHDAIRNLDRRAEGARRLLLACLDVELDVLLRADVDAEVVQRRLERRQHRVGGELLVPLGRAEEPRDVPALRLVERDAEALSQQRLDRLLEQALRVGEDGAALVGQLVELEAEAAVQLDGVGRAEILHRLQRDCRRLAVDRVHVLLGQLVPRLLERSPLVAVGLVRHRRTQHAEADLLAVHVRLDRRLERGDLLRVLLREVGEVFGAAEVPELADGSITVDRSAQRSRVLQRRQLGIAVVDLRDVERVLVTRVVHVPLVHQLREEAVGLLADGRELGARERLGRHSA